MNARALPIWLALALLTAMMVSALSGPVNLFDHPAATVIPWDIRLPRVVAAALTGLALGGSGAAMQALLRNPLAEPGTMGVSACAALGATAALYFGLADAAPWAVAPAAMLGALGATLIITWAGVRQQGMATMLLTGVALSAVAGAIMALFVNLAPNPFSLSDLINWTAGSVANRDWEAILWSAPLIVAGLTLIGMTRASLSALAFGEDVAHGLGVPLRRTRLLVVIGTGLATGGAVALAGVIGFVGLIAPHVIRAMTGLEGGRLLWPSALMAALLLVLADLVIRSIPVGNELHLGTLAALVGAPMFALIALRMGSRRHG